MLEGYDSSYIQGDFHPPAWAAFGIPNASRANVGLSVGSWYHEQVDNLRAAGKHAGAYFFNGNVSPVTCAQFFVNTLHDPRPEDTWWLDCESEGATGTVAWTGTKAAVWLKTVHQMTGKPYGQMGVYVNGSVKSAGDWQQVVDLGARLWIAAWGYDPSGDTAPWPDWTIWQDATRDGVDHNLSKVDLSTLEGGGASPIKPRRRRKMRLIWDTKDGGTTRNTGYLVTEAGRMALASMQVYNLFFRLINSDQLAYPGASNIQPWVPSATDGVPQMFNTAEVDIIDSTLRLMTVQHQTGIKIDPDKLASALKDAGVDISADVDPEQLAAAFEKVVPRVSAAVIKQLGEKLTASAAS